MQVSEFGGTDKADQEINNKANCVNFTSSTSLIAEPDCKMHQFINTYAFNNCDKKYSCEFYVSTQEIKNQCKILNQIKNIYISYQCLDEYVELGSLSIDRTSLSYLIVYIDVAGVLILFITILIIKFDYNKMNRTYKESNKVINQYTLNISNLAIDFDSIDKELNDLSIHLDSILNETLKSSITVIDEETKRFGNTEKIEVIKKRENEFENLNSIKNPEGINLNVTDKNEFNSFIYEINYPFISDKKLSLILKKEKEVANYFDKKTKLESILKIPNNEKAIESLKNNLESKKENLKKTMEELNSTEIKKSGKINDIFITFSSPRYSKFLFNKFNKSRCTRFWFICCCNYKKIKNLNYKNSWLNIKKNPDNPTNIKWQNMLISPWSKCFFKFISIFLSIFLILISFGIIVAGKYFEDLLNQEFNNDLNCNYVEYTLKSVQDEYFNQNLSKRSRIQTYCFCKNLLAENGITGANNYFSRIIQTFIHVAIG